MLFQAFSSCGKTLRAPWFAVARVFCSFLFSCCLCLAALSPTAAVAKPQAPLFPPGPESSVARILYTADTLGDTAPCTTCGNTPTGGLARRAAYLKTSAAQKDRPLILAGPDEFYSDRDSILPDLGAGQNPTTALHAAYSHMPYAAIYLSPRAARDMRTAKLAPPPNAVPVTDQPVTRLFRAGSLTVACVFLPAGTGPKGAPAPEQIQAATRAATEAAQDATCIIAISPWGIQAENALASSFGGYFHIILGGGEGIAVPGQATGKPGFPGPLWVRSDRRGRAVSELEIFSLPDPGSPWLEGVNFSSRLVFLDHHMPRDETVLTILKTQDDAE